MEISQFWDKHDRISFRWGAAKFRWLKMFLLYCCCDVQPIRRFVREILSGGFTFGSGVCWPHRWSRSGIFTEPLGIFGSVEQLYCFASLFCWGRTYLNSQEVIWTATTVAELKINALVPSVERSQQTVQQRNPKQPRSDISQRSFALKNNQAERARRVDSWWSPAGGQVMTSLWPEGIGSRSQKAFKENCVELLLLLSQLSFLTRWDGFTSVPKGFPKVFVLLWV